MAVYFKFKSAKDFDSVSIDGHFISVAILKERIVEQKKLGTGYDFDLVISDAQSNEEYTDEGFLVPKNTSVIVRRVPRRPSMPIVADVGNEQKSVVEAVLVNSGFQKLEPIQTTLLQPITSDGLDDFGVDLYAVPEVAQALTTSLTDEEDKKIKAFVDASASEWQRQTQDNLSVGKVYGNKGQGRGLPLRGYGRGFEKKTPPQGYICHRCGVTGHYIQHCPTNGDPTYDVKKAKPPTGIPKTMLFANPDGSYALPTGEVAVLKPNEAVFDREVDGLLSSNQGLLDIPPELCCPLCKGVLKEAVLTSKCCFKSFCDKCIRNEIISKASCVCGAKNILADDLLPNRTLRDAISRFLESQASAPASGGKVGSRVQLPDVESAPYARLKRTSPAASVSLKEASSFMMASDGSDTNERFAGGKEPALLQADASARPGLKDESGNGKRTPKGVGSLKPQKQGLEGDGSPESQLTKDSVQEVVSLGRPVRVDTEINDQGLTVPQPLKGKKKHKGKRVRQVDLPYSDGMWGQGLNPHGLRVENCCVHCGSYEHPSWNCYMLNAPGPSHHHPAMQGPMFEAGFNPEMRGMMHLPVGEGCMMPYHYNPGPYNAPGIFSNTFHFNGPMIPPHETYVSYPEMMQFGSSIHRDYVDPTVMSRDEFEARKVELKRRGQRELRFGREQVLHSALAADMGPVRLHGVRSRRDAEQLCPAEIEVSRVRQDWTIKEELQHSSDGMGFELQGNHVGRVLERRNPHWIDETSRGEELLKEGRHSRAERSSFNKQKGRVCSIEDNVGSPQDVQRRYAFVYDSEDDGDLRRVSGSKVGPSSTVGGRHVIPDEAWRETVDNSKDSSRARQQGVPSFVNNIKSRDRPRGSVFERTNLPIKPRRTLVDEEYDMIDGQDTRVKTIKASRRWVSEGGDMNDSQETSKKRIRVTGLGI